MDVTTINPLVHVLTTEEFRDKKEQFINYKDLLHSLGSIRYCKVEVYKNSIIGTLRIPQKNEERTSLMAFAFYLTNESLYLIEDTGDLKKWISKNADMIQNSEYGDHALLQVIELFLEEDIIYISHLEKQIEDLEDSLNNGLSKNFFSTLTIYRGKLLELNAYYEQLSAMSGMIRSHANFEIVHCEELWDALAHHTEQLQNYVHLLRENVLQVRELYQSIQDARQNKIMGILTVVTTIFLPLTLLTGWYGMNFHNMPELEWEYGYYAIITVAVVIVVLEIWYFKKKKFF